MRRAYNPVMRNGRIPFHVQVATAVALSLIVSCRALACDTSYFPISMLYPNAPIVFIGKVVESPWTPQGVDSNSRHVVRFSVIRNLRGGTQAEITLPIDNSSCFYPFLKNVTYLVLGKHNDGAFWTGQGFQPLPIEDAAEQVKYIEAVLANRPLGIIYGFAPVGAIVHLQNPAGESFRVTMKSTLYEVAAPPGDYRIWIERDGRITGDRRPVRVKPLETIFLRFEDPQ
jgi:hypothetical protein